MTRGICRLCPGNGKTNKPTLDANEDVRQLCCEQLCIRSEKKLGVAKEPARWLMGVTGL